MIINERRASDCAYRIIVCDPRIGDLFGALGMFRYSMGWLKKRLDAIRLLLFFDIVSVCVVKGNRFVNSDSLPVRIQIPYRCLYPENNKFQCSQATTTTAETPTREQKLHRGNKEQNFNKQKEK